MQMSRPPTDWLIDGLVRGMLVGILYPLLCCAALAGLALINTGVPLEQRLGNAVLVSVVAGVVGLVIGFFVGPCVGAIVGGVCCFWDLISGRWLARSAIAALGVATVLVASIPLFRLEGPWSSVTSDPLWAWVAFSLGPAVVAVVSVAVRPLPDW